MTRSIDIEALCAEKGLRITEQRKVIARVLGRSPRTIPTSRRSTPAPPRSIPASRSPPSTAPSACSRRPASSSGTISATAAPATRPRRRRHHDHLIDVETGNVIEFVDEELEQLQRRIAEKLGFRLVDHRMELYGVALSRDN